MLKGPHRWKSDDKSRPKQKIWAGISPVYGYDHSYWYVISFAICGDFSTHEGLQVSDSHMHDFQRQRDYGICS